MSIRRRSALRCAAVTAALATAAIGADSAGASLTGPGVDAGKNITVFHNIDFVAIFGYGPVGQKVTVDVIRNGVKIGTATGPTVDTPEGPGLEVNHGPAGAPVAGDCFTGHTPDILPGDRIVVTNGTDTDEVTVDNIRFTGQPFLAANGDVMVPGRASRFDGTPIDPAALDSGEFRQTSKFRGGPSAVIRTPGTTDGFSMVYRPPYLMERNELGLDLAGRRQALLGEGHAIGFGHVVPLPLESMLVDGIADAPGPALGCEASPSQADSVLSADDTAVNLASGDLVLTGSKMAAADAVSVSLTDAAGATTGPLTPTLTGNDWTLTVPRAQLDALADGPITAAGTFTHGATDLNGRTLELAKDVVAPVVTPDKAPGTYTAPLSVALSAGAGETITYRNRGIVRDYTAPIELPLGTTTLAVHAVDAAGNASDSTFTYTVERAAAAPAGAAPVVLPQLSPARPAVTLRARSLRGVKRVRAAKARRSGLSASFVAPRGARVAVARLYKLRGAKRTAVLARAMTVRANQRRTVRLRSSRLVPGLYMIEVRVGASRSALGPASILRVRVIR